MLGPTRFRTHFLPFSRAGGDAVAAKERPSHAGPDGRVPRRDRAQRLRFEEGARTPLHAARLPVQVVTSEPHGFRLVWSLLLTP